MATSTATITTDPTLGELAETCGDEVEFPRGHIIFAQGEPGSELYIIRSGKVKLGRKLPDGRENLLMIHGPSEVFGELNVFDPGPREATATTITETRAITLDHIAFRQWITARPELAEHMLRYLAKRVRRVSSQLTDQILIDVPARLAKVLLQLAQRFGTLERGLLRVTHDLTQEELAQLIGASRETVNKVLADFTARGWLRAEPRSVLILDPDRLARRAR